MKLLVTLNNKKKQFDVPAHRTLLDLLRSQGLWSIKHGCETGYCGNCTIILDNQAVYSCNMLAAQVHGKSIETYESIEEIERFEPLRQAFADFIDPECCYCLPGYLMSTKALLDQNPEPTEEEIVDALSGNVCRCTSMRLPVDEIINAVRRMKRNS